MRKFLQFLLIVSLQVSANMAWAQPTASVTPTSFNVSLTSCPDSTTQVLTIGNTGLSDLTYNLDLIQISNNHANFFEGFESGNISTWTDLGGPYTMTVTTNAPASGSYCFGMTGGANNYYDGVSHGFPSSQANYISYKVKSPVGSPTWNCGVNIGHSSDIVSNGAIADSWIDNGSMTIYLWCGNGTFTYPMTQGTWYTIEYRNINYTAKTFDFYVNGNQVAANCVFWNTNITSIDVIHLMGYTSGGTSYFDDIYIAGNMADWALPAITSGTVTPLTSTPINVKFRSTYVAVGTYTGQILVSTNDVSNPVITVPCTLSVSGNPNINIPLTPPCYTYTNLMAGDTDADTFLIENRGCDTLFISNVTSSSADFTVNSYPPYVPGYSSGNLVVTFNSSLPIGLKSASITVFNSDADTAFCVQGSTIPAPIIGVSPASFNVTIPTCNDSVTQILTINNTGGSDLTGTIVTGTTYLGAVHKYAYVCNSGTNNVTVINSETNTIVATVPVGSNPWRTAIRPDGKVVYVSNRYSSNISVISTSNFSVIATISVTGEPSGICFTKDSRYAYVCGKTNNGMFKINAQNHTVLTTLNAASLNEPMDVAITPDESKLVVATQSSGITLIDLSTFTVSGNLPGSDGAQSVAITPDGSKAYVSESWTDVVKVINLPAFTLQTTLTGFDQPHGLDITRDGTTLFILDKYNFKIKKYSVATNTLISEVTDNSLDNSWDLVLSHKEKYIYASVPFPSVNSAEDVLVYDRATMTRVQTLSTGNNSRGMAAIRDVYGTFLNVAPATFTVTPSGTTTVSVEFNGLDLVAGTYITSLYVNTNDPVNPQVVIPCTLNITAPPDFKFVSMTDVKAPNCLDLDSIMVNTTSRDTILIANLGCDTLTLDSIKFSPSVFWLDTAAFPIAPGDTSGFVVAFTPTAVTTYNGTVSVYTNDLDTVFCLYGKSFPQPVLTYTPSTGFTANINCSGTVNDTLYLSNTGGSLLNYIISETGNGFNYDSTKTINFPTSGASSTFTFTSTPNSDSVYIDITLNGDFDSGSEYAQLVIEGTNFGTIVDNNLLYTDMVFSYAFGGAQVLSWLADGKLTITLNNTGSVGGGGYHKTRVRFPGLHWLSETPVTGNVPVGTTDTIVLTFNSNNLLAGQYTGNVYVISNDPLQSNVAIPCTLNVLGSADLHLAGLSDMVAPNCLWLDSIMVYTTSRDTIFLTNIGCDSLVIDSVKFSPSIFSADTVTVNILPGDTGGVVVAFTPTVVGTFSGSVIIYTNDIDTTICLKGKAYPRPIITYTPSSFTVNVGCNSVVTDTLLIDNIGGSDLNFNLINFGGALKINAAILAADNTTSYRTDVQAKLLSTGRFNLVDIYNVATSTPTLAQLMNYEAVLVWSNNSFANNVQMGDVLADYVDAGGGVVCAVFTTAFVPLGGRFNTNNYWCIPPSGQTSGSATMGTVYQPSHPIMDNVSSFDGGSSSYRQTSNTVHPSATRIADWTDGRALIATRNINGHHRVDLGFFPPSATVIGGGWVPSTDGADIMANALFYSYNGGADWLTLSNDTDTVAAPPVPDSSLIVLSFNSANLVVGTYTTNVLIQSNDPLSPQDTVPVTMNVIGAPLLDFAGLADTVNLVCLDFDSIMQNTTGRDSLYIANAGCDTLWIDSVKFSPTIFTAGTIPFYILPDDTLPLRFNFTPVATGTFTGTATVYTNSIDTAFCLRGISYPKPVICNNPAALTTTLSCSDTTVIPLEICNTGGSNLNWSLSSPFGFCGMPGGGSIKVAVYNNATITSLLNTQPDLQATTVSTYNAASLANYDVLMNIRNGNLNQADVLAWINAGGTWIGEWSSNTIPVSTWGAISGTTGGNNSGSMSVIVNQPSHYLATNINWASMPVGANPTDFMYDIDLTDPAATTIVSVNHSTYGVNPLLVEKKVGSGKIILFNWDYQDDPYYNAVVQDMIQEVVRYGGSSIGWYCPAPTTGTVTPAGTQTVNVTFISTGQVVGTYTSTLTINSNDPLNPAVSVPVSMTVIGTADFDFSKFSDTINGVCLNLDSIMENTTSQDTVFFANYGCDTLWVDSIRITNPVFNLINSSGYVLPGDTGRFIIRFAPVASGTFVATANLYTNDLDTGFCLRGVSYPKPVQCHNPNSFYEHFLVCQDSLIDTLEICNTGAGNLNYGLWSPGGRNVQLDGNGDWLNRATTNLPTGSVMTVEAWVKPVALPDGTYNGIVSFGGRFCNGNALVLSMQNNGRPSMATWCWDFVPSSGPTAALNQWNHVACVLNGNAVTLYLNGVAMSGTLGGVPSVDPNSLGIGVTDYPGRYFNGNIDEVRIYNRALTQTEIVSTMYRSLAGNEPGLMAYFNFDDSTGTDQSVNTNDLTVNGNAFYTNANVNFKPVSTGTVTPAGTQTVQVVFKKAGLTPGIHNFPIMLSSNDPVNPKDTILVTFDIDAAPPSPTAGSNSPVCAGNDLSLTASTITGATYSWTGPNSFTSSLQNPVITAATTAAAGTYSVTASVAGCPQGAAGTTMVVINPPPSVPVAGSNSSLCSGQVLSLTASTVTGATYSWNGPNSFTSTLQNPTIAGVSTAAAGTYSVVAIAPGCPPSGAGTATVAINQTPSIPIAGSNSPICAGNDLSLTANTLAGVTYNWTGPNSFTSSLEDPVITAAATSASGTYSVTASENGCTSMAGATTVTVNPAPGAPSAGSNSTVCTGQILSLTASTISGAAYNWNGPNSFTSTLQNPVIAGVSTAAAGTYSVSATVPGCPTGPAGTTLVAVNVTPSAPSAASNSPICAGSDLSLTAGTVGGSTYNWNGPSSYTSSLQNPVIVSAATSATGTYSVYATEFGCTSTAGTVSVTVHAIPAAPTASYVIPACVGGNLSLTASAISGASYSWTGPNSFTASVQNPVLSGISTSEAGTYTVNATVNGCTGPSGTITVTVNPTPAPPVLSSNSPVCSGTTLSLTATAGGSPSYAWNGPNGFTSASQNPTIGSVTTLGNGTYSATVTELGCKSAAATTSVVVNQTPSAPVVSSNSPICAGNDLSLNASTSGSPFYSWTGPNSFTSTLQNPVIVAAGTNASGTYSVTAAANGCTGPAGTASVTVNPPPASPVAGSNSPVCSGNTLSLTASSTGTTYTWSGPNSFTSGLQNPTIGSITTLGNGTYSVVANVPGCPSSAPGTVNVTINQTPSAPVAASNSPVCAGNDISLTASTSGSPAYSWTGPNSFTSNTQDPVISAATTAMSGTYSVTATANGCTGPRGTVSVTVNNPPSVPVAGGNTPVCSGQNLSLTASNSGTSYSWTGPNSYTSTVQNPVLTAITSLGDGTYSVTASTAGCAPSAAGTVSISVTPSPAAPTASSNSPVCVGSSISLTATASGSPTYSWTGPAGFTANTQNPVIAVAATANAGTYSVTATESGCTGPAGTTSVIVNTPPTVPVASSNSPVCEGANLSLTASTVSGSTYNWSGPNSYTATAQNPVLSTITTAGAGTYSVTATRPGCPPSAAGTTSVTVNPLPAAPTAGSNSPICAGTTLSLTASAAGSSYAWTGPNSFTASLQNPTIVSASTAAGGTYSVSAISAGCTGPAGTVSVTVYPIPNAPVTGSNSPICSGMDISLTATAGAGAAYAWTGPNSFTSTTQNPTITAATTAEAGTYSVTSTENGCTGPAGTTTVVVSNAPATPVAGSNTPVCSGQTLTLTATATGSYYDWNGPNGFTSSAQNPTIGAVTTAAAGTYSVAAVNPGCPPSAVTTTSVSIIQSPSAPTVSSNSPICAGSDLSLTAATSGSPAYSWNGPAGYTSSAQNPVIVAALTSASGTYSVTATENGCTGPAATLTATVNPMPAAPSASSNSPVCAGQSLSLSASTSGSPSYNWSGPNGFTSSLQNSEIQNTTTAATGTYSVSATANGCTGPASTVSVTVNPVPAVPMVNTNDTSSCFGSATPLLIGSGTNINWYNSSVVLVSTNDTLNTGLTAVGSYTFYVSQTNTVTGCESVKDTVTLTIHAVPGEPLALDTAVCSAATIPNLTATGTNVIWYNASMTQVGTGNSYATGMTAAGSYTYFVTDRDLTSGCESPADTSVLTIMLSPPVPQANNVAVCFGNPVPFLTSTGSNVSWYSNASLTNLVNTGNTFNTGQTAVGAYTYWVTDSLPGCSSSAADSVTLFINTLPGQPMASDTTYCFGSAGVLTSTGANSQWYSDPTLINMIGTGSPFNTGITAVGSYTYYVTDFAAGCGNSPSDTAVMTINPSPAVTANTYSTVIVQGNSVNLNVYNASTYVWSPPAGLNTTTGSAVVASPTVTTTYTVVGTNAYGCSTTITIQVAVNPLSVSVLNAALQDITLFPNPAIDHFTVEFNTVLETPIDIYMINLLGDRVKVLHSEGVKGAGLMKHSYTIDTHTMTEGVYTVEIITSEGIVARRVVLFR